MTRRTRTVLAAVALWLVIVGGTSTLAWVVIDRAGREVFVTDASGAGPARPATSAATGPRAATGQPSPSRTTSPTASSTPVPHRPTPQSTASTPPAGSTTPGAGTSSSKPSTPPPATVTDSVTVDGGTVGVSCQGSTISLRSVTPRDGWSFELERDSRTLEVKFTQLQAHAEVEVHATCSGGQPVFETGSDPDPGEGSNDPAEGSGAPAEGSGGPDDAG